MIGGEVNDFISLLFYCFSRNISTKQQNDFLFCRKSKKKSYIESHSTNCDMSKEKFHIEFVMGNATQNSLWRMIGQTDGLSEWFADEVAFDETDNTYTFSWSKSNNSAELQSLKPLSAIRFRWLDEDDEAAYFEFALHKLDLSGEMALEITDFADPDEKGDAISLWEQQVNEMKRRLGV